MIWKSIIEDLVKNSEKALILSKAWEVRDYSNNSIES
jgi:hypothetical protein